MGFEARWEDSKDLCCCADTMESSLSSLLSLTKGAGRAYIYEFDKNGNPSKLVKVYSITN